MKLSKYMRTYLMGLEKPSNNNVGIVNGDNHAYYN